MNELAWIREQLADRRVSFVAKATGLSEPTIRAIRDNHDANPTLATLNKLAAYLQGQSA